MLETSNVGVKVGMGGSGVMVDVGGVGVCVDVSAEEATGVCAVPHAVSIELIMKNRERSFFIVHLFELM